RGAFPERLATDRLVLSRITEADLPDLTAMYRDARVMAALGGLIAPAEAAERHQRHLDHWARHAFGWWAARSRADGRFVGRGGLRYMPIGGREEVELGYGLVPEFWGQGLAAELAASGVRAGIEALGVPEVAAITLPTNARSRRVMEKVGFRYEREVEHAGL